MRWLVFVLALTGCDDLIGFGGAVPPLATIEISVTGDLPPDTVALRVALVWGQQWLGEARCFAPPASPELATALAAACRDPFAFTPARVAATVEIAPGAPATLELFELPSADVMVGDVSARVAYGSFVLYDDRDASGALELSRPELLPGNLNGPPEELDEDRTSADAILGASFVTMTEPDARLAFREGDFNAGAAFYPRSGCGAPLPSFSIVRAGGFSREAALAALAAGHLPDEDPASCAEQPLAVTALELQPREAREVACQQRRSDGQPRYRQPPDDDPGLATHPFACAPIADTGLTELVVAGTADAACKGLTEYTLRGCDTAADLTCDQPEWDFTATPPAWWPCPGAP